MSKRVELKVGDIVKFSSKARMDYSRFATEKGTIISLANCDLYEVTFPQSTRTSWYFNRQELIFVSRPKNPA